MKTKIVATIGPSSLDFSKIIKIYDAGMSIARINTKYGSFSQYETIMKNVRKISELKILFDIKGERLIDWLIKRDFDYLAVSFAESAPQIKKIRKLFSPRKIKIIAKIESSKGIKNVDELIRECDGIMVARGDLGENINLEKVPIIQKLIIKKCNQKNKMVITATEMLLSMVNSSTPERAEVSDVANAVLDGSDAVMLSEETAIGKYPILAVKTMAKIIKETEKQKNLLD